MKISRYLFTVILLFAWHTFLFALGITLQQVQKKDTLGIRNQIDSVFSLNGKDFKNAVLLTTRAISNARASNSKELIKYALYKGAMLDWYDGIHTQALKKTYEYLNLSKHSKDTVRIAKGYSLLGLIYLYTSDYDSSLFQFDKALWYHTMLKDTTQVIKNYGFKGLVYSLQGDYLRAKENLLSTVVLKRQYSTTDWGVLNLSNDEEFSIKYYREALFQAKKNIKILEEKTEPSIELRYSYHGLGLTYLKLNHADSALILFKKSADIARRVNVDIFWNELSRAYSNLGFYDSAIWCNIKAIENSIDHGTRISLANGYGALGSSYKSNGDYHNALIAYETSLSLHTLMEHKYARMNMMLHISKALMKDNQLNQALVYTDSAIAIAHLITTRKGLSEALDSRFHILKLKGDYKKALEVKQVYDTLVDSLQKGEVQLDLAKLDLYNDVELGKLEISELNKQKELSKANSENQVLIIVIILIVSFFLISLLLIHYFRTRKLAKLNVTLHKQQLTISDQNKNLIKSNKEKQMLLVETHHRVKNNLQTISSLLNIQLRKLKNPAAIRAIEDSKSRVYVMGLLHKFLYQHDDFEEISIKPYLEQLIKMLVESHKTDMKITTEVIVCDIQIDVDTSINIGLIINELIINSLKHAVPETVLRIVLKVNIKDNFLHIGLSDNGQANTIVLGDMKEGFGWKLVQSLVEKIGGELTSQHKKGFVVHISIPLQDTTAYARAM